MQKQNTFKFEAYISWKLPNGCTDIKHLPATELLTFYISKLVIKPGFHTVNLYYFNSLI